MATAEITAGANYGFFFDQSLCTGCKACQIACEDKHDLPVGVNWRRVVEYSGGSWQESGNTFTPNVFTYYTSIACNHCENAICMEVCPTTAMSRREDGTNPTWTPTSALVAATASGPAPTPLPSSTQRPVR